MEKLTMVEWVKLNEEANKDHAEKVEAILNRSFDVEAWEAEAMAELDAMEVEEVAEVAEVAKGNNTKIKLNKMAKNLVVALNKVAEGYTVTINDNYTFEANGLHTITVATQKEVIAQLKKVNYLGAVYSAKVAELAKHKADFEAGLINHCEYLWRTRYLR